MVYILIPLRLILKYVHLLYFSYLNSAHPYLFFNQDEGHSMTFMGLWIDKEGNLIHYRNGQKETAENNYMNQNLRNILAENGVQFMEEYDQLGKYE